MGDIASIQVAIEYKKLEQNGMPNDAIAASRRAEGSEVFASAIRSGMMTANNLNKAMINMNKNGK